MKKVNFKLLNLAFWAELVLSYVLPFRVIDDFQYRVGFPFPFIAVYDTAIGVNPLTSMNLNPLLLLVNVLVLYLVFSLAVGAYHRRKRGSEN